jgi:hypothetical protein
MTNIQQYSATYPLNPLLAYFSAEASTGAYSDASYIRLKNMSLSWQLPGAWTKKVCLEDCQFYLHGQNLFTITKWKGMDPETQSVTALPPLRVITLGLKVSL